MAERQPGKVDEVVRRVLDGDIDAYEEIVREYQGMLLGYASQRLTDFSLAKEVVQLSFIRAYQKIHEFRLGEDFGVWLCVICKYMIMTELERMQRDGRNKGNYKNQFEVELATALTEEDKEALQPVIGVMKKCIGKLKSEAASLVLLKYHEKKSCKEIADEKNRTVTWVTSNLSRVRQALKRCIQSQTKKPTL